MADKAFMSFTQNGEQVGLGHSLLVGGDTMEYRALVSDVAKKIIEDYAGSTLAGSAQTPKSAINALQGKLDRYIIIYNATYSVSGLTYNSPSISQAIDAIAGKGTGRYFVECRNSASYSDSYSALTTLNCTLIIDVLSSNYINVFGLAVASENGTTLFRAKSNGNWGNWVKQPTRTEITELNSNLATASTKNSGNLGENITGWADYVQFGKIVLVQFVLTNAAALTSNSKIVTGLPRPDRSYTIGDFKLFNNNVYFRIADDGSIVVTENIASSTNLRGAVTYITI